MNIVISNEYNNLNAKSLLPIQRRHRQILIQQGTPHED